MALKIESKPKHVQYMGRYLLWYYKFMSNYPFKSSRFIFLKSIYLTVYFNPYNLKE